MKPNFRIVFYLIGWHDQGALGDDLLAMVVRQIFQEGARACGIDLTWSDSPEAADYILVGGGTLLGVDNIGILEILRKSSKPYSIFGTGFRRERRDIGQANIENLRALFQGADYVFLRGYLSKQFCVHIGLREGEVIGDPALCFMRRTVSAKKSHGVKVGVSIRSMDNRYEPQYTDNAQCIEMIRDIALFIAGQMESEFFFFDLARNICDADQVAIEALMSELRGRCHCHLVMFDAGAEKSFSMLARMDHLISQRLHPSIIAWSSGIPHVTLDYQNGKTEDFLSSIGMTEFGLRTDDFTLNGYRRKWFRLITEHAIVASHARRSVAYWRDVQRCAADRILRRCVGDKLAP